MAADSIATKPGWWQTVFAFVRDSYHEVRFKTTWPGFTEVRQSSVAIIIFVLLIGLVITLLDTILHTVLVRMIPALFR